MQSNESRPLIGISGCLTGQAVRFNGGHCRNNFLLEKVASFADFHPVCPEVGVGMGVPRETLRQTVDRQGLVSLIAPKTGRDWTQPMRDWSEAKAAELAQLGLSGFVLKKDSPTCGMERVKVYDTNNVPAKTGVGLFAAALRREMPLLPIEEEGRLNDPRLRENFFTRVFAYQRLQRLFGGDWKPRDLVELHSREKFLILAHDPPRYRDLGRLVAQAGTLPAAQVAERYGALFMEALARPAQARRQVNVLEHVMGFFKESLDAGDKRELLGLIADFRRGITSLETPLTLIRHYARSLRVDYIARQTYLTPHPKQLMLRSVIV